jgi:hypothetical protein
MEDWVIGRLETGFATPWGLVYPKELKASSAEELRSPAPQHFWYSRLGCRAPPLFDWLHELCYSSA